MSKIETYDEIMKIYKQQRIYNRVTITRRAWKLEIFFIPLELLVTLNIDKFELGALNWPFASLQLQVIAKWLSSIVYIFDITL